MRRFSQHVRQQFVGYIALFVALGGVSYAALKLPAGSVGTRQLKKNAVTSAKVKNHSLTAADFRRSSLPVGATGPTGPTGPIGPKGDSGAPASAVVAHLHLDSPVTAALTPGHNDATLSGSWTQGANDFDLVLGTIKIKVPTLMACSSNSNSYQIHVSLLRGNDEVGQYQFHLYGGAGDVTERFPGTGQDSNGFETFSHPLPFLLPPGTDTPSQLTVLVRDFCDGSAHYQLEALDLTVLKLA